jgi:hypothetical protein
MKVRVHACVYTHICTQSPLKQPNKIIISHQSWHYESCILRQSIKTQPQENKGSCFWFMKIMLSCKAHLIVLWLEEFLLLPIKLQFKRQSRQNWTSVKAIPVRDKQQSCNLFMSKWTSNEPMNESKWNEDSYVLGYVDVLIDNSYRRLDGACCLRLQGPNNHRRV